MEKEMNENGTVHTTLNKEEIAKLTGLKIEDILKFAPADLQDKVKEAMIDRGMLETQEQKDNVFPDSVITKKLPTSIIINTIMTISQRAYIKADASIYPEYKKFLYKVMDKMENYSEEDFTDKDVELFHRISKYIEETQQIPRITDDDIDNWITFEEYNELFEEYKIWRKKAMLEDGLIPAINPDPEHEIPIPDKYVRLLIQSIGLDASENYHERVDFGSKEANKLYSEIVQLDAYKNKDALFTDEDRKKISRLFELLLSGPDTDSIPDDGSEELQRQLITDNK